MNIDLIACNCRYTHSCLALFHVRTELETHLPGCTPNLRQFTINDPYFETLLQVAGSGAEVLMFSVYIWNSTYLRRLLTDLSRLAPARPLVLGGPQAQALRQSLAVPVTVVHHEIEGVGKKFYQDLADGTLGADYWAEVAVNFISPYKQEDFASQLKNRYLYYESSRGCPFSCAYCLSSLSLGVRYKEVAQVRAELSAIFAHHPAMIRFVDRTFNADPKRTLEIWRFLRDHAPRPCTFHFEMAPDLFTEEMLEFLGGLDADLFQFEIGIQSTHPDTLSAINRKMDVAKALATLRRLRRLGTIRLHADLILGLPLQDRESFAKSVRDVLATAPHYLQMGLLKVLPDTAIAQRAQEYGIVACQEPPYQVLSSTWLDSATLARLYWLGECLEAFYNKGYFRTFFAHALRNPGDMFHFFEELTSLCLAQGLFQRAKTHALLNELLCQLVTGLDAPELRRELLLFDWLRHGQRCLPPAFAQDLTAHRDHLWRMAPAEVPGLYSPRERNHFFKRGVFCPFSPTVLAEAGLLAHGDGYGFVGFLSDGQGTTHIVAVPIQAAEPACASLFPGEKGNENAVS